MDAEEAIRSRRTVKAFDRRAVERETLEELLELARWAPNHNLTNPWRFRVIGPQALERLKEAAGELAAQAAPAGADPGECARVAAAKLDRAPTLVVCSAQQTGDDRSRTRRTCTRPASPPTSSCWARTRAGWPATGARPACCAPKPGRAAVGLPETSASSASSTSATRCRTASRPGASPWSEYAQFLD